MREEKKKKRGRVPFFSSIQMKYAMSYLAIVSVVLILLNTYPVLASQDLLFGSKRDSLKSQAAVMASALMELELDPANPEYIRTKWGVGYYLSGKKEP